MCGIAGFASREPFLNGHMLRAMNGRLRHRGPDDSGAFVFNETGRQINDEMPGIAGLAHRRLSIIDLSSDGHQPMHNEDRNIWLSYNGEFYNYGDYRTRLSKSHNFKSNTDSEVILHLYEDLGIKGTLERMNGMFAFALWDARKHRLILARDRLGQKPLYYMQKEDGSLIFASEIKAILETDMVSTNDIDPAALFQFWTYGYSTGEQTIFPQIKRLLPGHYGVWENGCFKTYEYWDCTFGNAETRREPLPELAEELESLLCDSIRMRLISDVPVGIFLSGGVDSALIAALTRQAVGADLDSYTIGFPKTACDESEYAAAIAKHLKLPNRILNVNEDMLPQVNSIVDHFDELFGDSSAIPTYFLSKLTSDHVTVALTGDGGDELFGGYSAYRKALQFWGDRKQRRLFAEPCSLIRRIMDEAFRHVYKGQNLTVIERHINPRRLRRILGGGLWRDAHLDNPLSNREYWYSRVADADLLSQLQYVNLKTYMVDDILVKVDRMSMAWGLECRSPFLDHRIVEFASSLPYEAKIDSRGRQKSILRSILLKYVPDYLIDRPKQGFSIPWSEWYQGPFGDKLRSSWKRQTNKYHKPRSGSLLFPDNSVGSQYLQWYAYCVLRFFEDRQS